MKKFLAVLVLCFSVLILKAQKPIGNYYNEYFGKTFPLRADTVDGDTWLYIGIHSWENEEAFISLVGEANIQAFVESLTKVRDKYVEWRKIAIDNNVQEFSKAFDIEFPPVNIAWYTDDWNFNFGHDLAPFFAILDGRRIVACFHSEVSSSSNEYVSTKYYLIFESKRDFDSLLSMIRPEVVKRKLNNLDTLFQ